MTLERDSALRALGETDLWDVLIIGGGATGLGCAVDAASRGYRTLLLEQDDFAKGTSSRSTKLIHGGVRYLRQGSVSLVLGALRERALLLQNAPHVVRSLAFVVPSYRWWERIYYGVGLKLYDLLARSAGFGRSRRLSRDETLRQIPTIEPAGLRGGVQYFDGQFDDARLAINLAQTADEHGGVLVNYAPVSDLIEDECGRVTGVRARDLETERDFEIAARVVINATGPYTDAVRRMDDPSADSIIAPSQGVHIVLDRSFLPGDAAIMIPETDDGRILFAIPWHGRVLIGTTDTPTREIPLEPRALPEELEFLLAHAARYLTRDPEPRDVLSVFTGLRPLVAVSGGGHTSKLSRDHTVDVSAAGLITVAGGKWTTYRQMAEDTIDLAIEQGGLDARACVTKNLRLHGHDPDGRFDGAFGTYGSDEAPIRELIAAEPEFAERLHPDHPVSAAHVVWAARHEAARTVEDVLSRRTRILLLDARASIEMAPAVARLLAEELGRDDDWKLEQVGAFTALAHQYLLTKPAFPAT